MVSAPTLSSCGSYMGNIFALRWIPWLRTPAMALLSEPVAVGQNSFRNTHLSADMHGAKPANQARCLDDACVQKFENGSKRFAE
mmetsp:Transcript_102265/g.177431  ORF Transcript_102265/g.177431 Transcript_102265/m.177431 type:complete len:84 (+) Transcript_102265:946-1197(+)